MSAGKLPQENDFQGWTIENAEMGINIKHQVVDPKTKKTREEQIRGRPYEVPGKKKFNIAEFNREKERLNRENKELSLARMMKLDGNLMDESRS